MAWPVNPRPAKSLLTLRDQVNEISPNRSKANDGLIGDERHKARTSDHNAWVDDNGVGVVTAIDITHDPLHGVDSYKLAEKLRTGQDSRIKYVISNRRIFSSEVQPWKWRPYNGTNPHDCHVHVSVFPDKRLYDSTAPWDIGRISRPQPNAPAIAEYPILKLGDSGGDVRELQRLLGDVPVDGNFDVATMEAVRGFQRTHDLTSDGVVGTYTWRELKKTPTRMTNIVASVFGGKADPQTSAYDGHLITDEELAVALPFRFIEPRPHVRVTNLANGRGVSCSIQDVGPWNTDDPYWTKNGGRPQAETGFDTRGRPTNKAGIDLAPAVAKAIGLPGMGHVDWYFEPTRTIGV